MLNIIESKKIIDEECIFYEFKKQLVLNYIKTLFYASDYIKQTEVTEEAEKITKICKDHLNKFVIPSYVLIKGSNIQERTFLYDLVITHFGYPISHFLISLFQKDPSDKFIINGEDIIVKSEFLHKLINPNLTPLEITILTDYIKSLDFKIENEFNANVVLY